MTMQQRVRSTAHTMAGGKTVAESVIPTSLMAMSAVMFRVMPRLGVLLRVSLLGLRGLCSLTCLCFSQSFVFGDCLSAAGEEQRRDERRRQRHRNPESTSRHSCRSQKLAALSIQLSATVPMPRPKPCGRPSKTSIMASVPLAWMALMRRSMVRQLAMPSLVPTQL